MLLDVCTLHHEPVVMSSDIDSHDLPREHCVLPWHDNDVSSQFFLPLEVLWFRPPFPLVAAPTPVSKMVDFRDPGAQLR